MTSYSNRHVHHFQGCRSYPGAVKNRMRDEHGVTDTETSFQFLSCTKQCASNFCSTMLENLYGRDVETGSKVQTETIDLGTYFI